MELGEKLRSARLEAGLSQRQLCGEEITRNMLSQIEHGTARPSMDTLRYLAARLDKPVSWFLEEESVVSPNQGIMEEARRFYHLGEYASALTVLETYREPDPVYAWERDLLEILLLLELAEAALESGREPYARELTERIRIPEELYCAGELKRRHLLLRGRLFREELASICAGLPSTDEELLLRAECALGEQDGEKAGRLLEAAECRDTLRWNLLRGRAHMARQAFRKAIPCLLAAEKGCPGEAAQLLEICYRETGNYKQAYLYACRQKK